MRVFASLLMALSLPIEAADDVVLNQAWEDLVYLASTAREGRAPNTVGSEDAQRYISERFANAALQGLFEEGQYRHPFSYESGLNRWSGTNLIGVRSGQSKQFIVITAHYDHIGRVFGVVHPGADDNASGVAAMLALAQQSQSRMFTHSLMFVATDAEEKGLIGSKALIEGPNFPLDSVSANINLDMLAQLGRPARLYLSGTNTHQAFDGLVSLVNQSILQDPAIRLIKEHRQPRGRRSALTEINFKNASDHAVFADNGIPYLFFGVGVHPYYHSPDDSADRIDAENFKQAVTVAWALLNEVDQRLSVEN
ncbi:M20/M25/M40 family metallo-hydrolase [Alteromonas facilis]|uniref:M20/M25/M40 family metallo-hydrolase n=1 Tax=Alteromonas facilis TaxID=2048004 RepID=UPI000C28ADBE|nr:M20/M25/M40 family metallo-hydrolase [Alteromonas facilis]